MMPEIAEQLTLQIKRVLPVPAEQAYSAWVKQEILEQWMCCDQESYSTRYLVLDVRPGGRFVLEIRTPEGDVYLQHGTFMELLPLKKLVFTWFDEMIYAHGVGTELRSPKTLVTVDLKEQEGTTELTLTHEQFTSRREYDATLESWNTCFDLLERTLHV